MLLRVPYEYVGDPHQLPGTATSAFRFLDVTRHPAFVKRGEHLRRIGTFLHERRLRIVAIFNDR
jgi:hypothetical protein